MYIEIVQKAKGKKWYWRIKAKNGEIIAHSENYERLSSARKTADRVFDGEFSIMRIVRGNQKSTAYQSFYHSPKMAKQ